MVNRSILITETDPNDRRTRYAPPRGKDQIGDAYWTEWLTYCQSPAILRSLTKT